MQFTTFAVSGRKLKSFNSANINKNFNRIILQYLFESVWKLEGSFLSFSLFAMLCVYTIDHRLMIAIIITIKSISWRKPCFALLIISVIFWVHLTEISTHSSSELMHWTYILIKVWSPKWTILWSYKYLRYPTVVVRGLLTFCLSMVSIELNNPSIWSCDCSQHSESVALLISCTVKV